MTFYCARATCPHPICGYYSPYLGKWKFALYDPKTKNANVGILHCHIRVF